MITEVTRHDVERLIAAGARVVDVLGAKEFADSHLPRAINLPLEEMGDAANRLDPNQATVVYCYDSVCDRSSRAAWRLASLGFSEVYDYVDSKIEWMGAGLPFEGERFEQPHLATLVDESVPTCGLREKTRGVTDRVGDAPVCVVVDEQRVVLGLLTADVLRGENAVVDAVMEEGPQTFRPYKSAAEIAKKLDKLPHSFVLVTTLDGKLVGTVTADAIRSAG